MWICDEKLWIWKKGWRCDCCDTIISFTLQSMATVQKFGDNHCNHVDEEEKAFNIVENI